MMVDEHDSWMSTIRGHDGRFKLFCSRLTDRQMDVCDYRVVYTSENLSESSVHDQSNTIYTL